MFEFHVSRQARDRYNFDQPLFSFNGNVIFANFHAARLFAQKINQKQDLVNFPERAVKAGQINAMGLLDEILHLVVFLYHQKYPETTTKALEWLDEHVGSEAFEKALLQFINEFPPITVYLHQQTAEEYLQGSSEGVSNRAIALEELFMLWVANKNPALSPFIEFFDDEHLQVDSAYLKITKGLYAFFETQPTFGPEHQNLLEMLRSPAVIAPHSLPAQLDYVRTHWAELLGRYLYRLLSSMDLIKEEEKLAFQGPGPISIPVYSKVLGELESEHFSPDREWMPHLVLIAKNSYVWLDQLTRQYQRSITQLSQIPDEELDTLASEGITGLWLIGLWERSPASARIKRLCGNPEAIPSAYSLFSYEIAHDLGGEEAYQNLRDRAWHRGIRLASDMVPNHMGIDSPWVIEHPNWFIGLNESPFPSYTFFGPNLSNNPYIGIYVEDHYYKRTDAAVVFKRVDFLTGQQRYIYHGNDGTSMPWNDTAQLNYLNPEVREAVTQTILEVARKFPIIRFDAAMTLAKRHFQRLWFPEPGGGGAIPSRAENGLTKEQFEAAFPIEFWREVVDRVALEVPDTLLLAEAFWLMEGYFVRTLGMHRVYNSAFMNLLRNEENGKYRSVIKNTLEFDPEILKRFVNFMNNPDERTAVDQFGKGDKYFGICTLLATLPGLPMFGHGQIEGYTEKYGMEFRRAYWDEKPDPYLVERHKREIFPLLHKRYLFAGVTQFLLYDFFTPEGSVNEDVLAYSNGEANERALVVYHNKFAHTCGWIRVSVGFMDKSGESKETIQRSLGEGLNLIPGDQNYVVFQDAVNGMEYIYPSTQICEQGLFLELDAYKCHVFINFRCVTDDTAHSYAQLCQYLNGRGVPSMDEALNELVLLPVLSSFRQISNPNYFSFLLSECLNKETTSFPNALLDEAEQKMSNLLDGIHYMTGLNTKAESIRKEVRVTLQLLKSLQSYPSVFANVGTGKLKEALTFLMSNLEKDDTSGLVLLGWSFIRSLGKLAGQNGFENQSLSWLDEWRLGSVLEDTYISLGKDEPTSWEMVQKIRWLISFQNWFQQISQTPKQALQNWLADDGLRQFLQINRYKDVLWFNKEAFEEFTWWLMLLSIFQINEKNLSTSAVTEQILSSFAIIQELHQASEASGYQVTKLLSAMEDI